MIELGQLEQAQEEFNKRKTRVIVVSLEDQETAAQTQKDFPHLLVLADADRKLAEALEVIQPDSNPAGGDTSAPTTVLVDGNGIVRWMYRSPSIFRRLSPEEALAALDRHGP